MTAGALCGINLCTAANLRGNEPWAAWAALLAPFGSGLALAPRVAHAEGAQSRRGTAADAAVAAAGWIFSLCLAAAASEAAERAAAAAAGATEALAVVLGAAACGAWACAIGATASDARDALALIINGRALKVRAPRRTAAALRALTRQR